MISRCEVNLCIAVFFNVIGQVVFYICISWYALEVSGSVSGVGLVLVGRPIVSLLLGSLVGVLVDRMDRFKLFAAGQILKAVGVAALMIGTRFADAANIGLGTLCATALIVYLGTLISIPCIQALIQSVSGASIMRAVTLAGLVTQAADIVGMAGGGIAIALLGLNATLGLSAAFALAAVIFAATLCGDISREPRSRSGYGASLREGVQLICGNERLMLACISVALVWSVAQITMTLLAGFTKTGLGLGVEAYGWIEAMWGVGTALAGLLILKFNQIAEHHLLRKYGILVLACAVAVFSRADSLAAAMLLHACVGLAFAFNRVCFDGLILSTVPRDKIGRVRSNIESLIGLLGIGIFLSPNLFSMASAGEIYAGFSACLILSALGLVIWSQQTDRKMIGAKLELSDQRQRTVT